MSEHAKGLLITAIGVLLIVPDSLYVRLIDAPPFVTVFWRSLIAGMFVAVLVLAFQGTRPFILAARTGLPGLIYSVLMGTTGVGLVLAVVNTSVANVVFIFASIPIFAAIFSRIFLGEPIRARIVMTMLAVMVGLAVIAYGSDSHEIAHWSGDLWALYTSAAYAAALTAVRRVKDVSMVPAVPFGYIGAAFILLFFTQPFAAFPAQWVLFVGHGLLIGVATCLLTLGPRYLSAPEVSLLILLESVLAPLLVWAVIGEDPGPWALAGGAIVIGALIISNIVLLRRRARA